jgi:hypothetical protein
LTKKNNSFVKTFSKSLKVDQKYFLGKRLTKKNNSFVKTFSKSLKVDQKLIV